MPSAVTVTLDPDGVNQQVRAAVQADGTFTGEFSFEQIVSQDYIVQATIPCTPYTDPYSGEVVSTRVLDSIYIDVKEFTTPAYTIAGEVDGIIYRYGDEVTATDHPHLLRRDTAPELPARIQPLQPLQRQLRGGAHRDDRRPGGGARHLQGGGGGHRGQVLLDAVPVTTTSKSQTTGKTSPSRAGTSTSPPT